MQCINTHSISEVIWFSYPDSSSHMSHRNVLLFNLIEGNGNL